MAPIAFSLTRDFDVAPRQLWDELIDWKAHEAWIPASRVEVDSGDPTAVGATFTAWTGVGPLALEDRMRVTERSWDDEAQSGRCEVAKLGPVLRGTARFVVVPHGEGSRLEWVEDVSMAYLPGFLSPVAGKVGAAGFTFGIKRLVKLLANTP